VQTLAAVHESLVGLGGDVARQNHLLPRGARQGADAGSGNPPRARQMQVTAEEELERLLPKRVAVVEVTLADGAHLSERNDTVRGTPEDPMSKDEIVVKARDVIAPGLAPRHAPSSSRECLGLSTKTIFETFDSYFSGLIGRKASHPCGAMDVTQIIPSEADECLLLALPGSAGRCEASPVTGVKRKTFACSEAYRS
jgi:hypothetical protein